MVDNNNKKFKLGFSLAEALVSMLVLSIFFIATSKMLTAKPKKEIEMNRHGYFECYWDDIKGVVMQKRSDGGFAGTPAVTVKNTCRFEPPHGIAFAMIYAYHDEVFYVSKEPQFTGQDGNEEITISGGDLSSFEQYMENPVVNSNIFALENFLEACYPTSTIYEKISDHEPDGPILYQGPAVFIGW